MPRHGDLAQQRDRVARDGAEVGDEVGGGAEAVVRVAGDEGRGFVVDEAGGEEEGDVVGLGGGGIGLDVGAEEVAVDFQAEFGWEAEEGGGHC